MKWLLYTLHVNRRFHYLIILLLICNISFGRGIVLRDFALDGPIIQGNNANILLSGTFDDSSYNDLNKVFTKYNDSNIIIYANSNGGIFKDYNSIIKIMDLIHKHNVKWVVGEKARCYSMCAIAGMSAKKISGVLYFHGVHNDIHYNNSLNKIVRKEINVEANEKVLNKLRQYGHNNYDFKEILNKIEFTAIHF
jgi:hypothetical protein